MRHLPALLSVLTPVFLSISGAAHAEWNGAYIGATGKVLNGHSPSLNGEESNLSFKTIVGSALAGYNLTAGHIVFGFETGIDKGGKGVHEDGYYNFEYSSIFYTGARLGYDAGRFLPYAKISQLKLLYNFSADYPMFASLEQSGYLTGTGYGIGVDMFVKGNAFARIELERRVFHEEDFNFGAGLEVSFDGQIMDVLSIGVGYQF